MKALVTGASEGIGRAFAQRLAQEGYIVTAVARNEARLKELIAELGPQHKYVVADLSTEQGMREVSQVLKSDKQDLLINNAGFGANGEFYKSDIIKQVEMLRTNCEAVMVLSHSFLQGAKSGDALVNLASVLAFLPLPLNNVYAASKAFVTSFTDSLWYESKKRGIYVMSLCPGITRTNFQVRSHGKDGQDYYPPGITQTPQQVVDVAMQALKKRRSPVVVSGIRNTMLSLIPRILSHKTVLGIVGKRQ